jgi:hypothetical protein
VVPFAISRITLFSLLVGLLLATGLRIWYVDRNDACTRYMAGDKSLPASEWVITGTQRIEIPCSHWLERMPLGVQLLCLCDGALATIFLLNGAADTRAWLQARRRIRQKL